MQLEILRQAAFRFDCRHRRMVSVGLVNVIARLSHLLGGWVQLCIRHSVAGPQGWIQAAAPEARCVGVCSHDGTLSSVHDGCCVYTMDTFTSRDLIGWVMRLPTLHDDAW